MIYEKRDVIYMYRTLLYHTSYLMLCVLLPHIASVLDGNAILPDMYPTYLGR